MIAYGPQYETQRFYLISSTHALPDCYEPHDVLNTSHRYFKSHLDLLLKYSDMSTPRLYKVTIKAIKKTAPNTTSQACRRWD